MKTNAVNMANLKKIIAHMANTNSVQKISILDNHKVRVGSKVYEPLPTLSKFHECDKPFRVVMGAIRSGKSSGCCLEIVKRACNMPPCKDGVRRCRAVVFRNTYPDLETTTIKTWQNWLSDLGTLKTNFGSPVEFFHTFDDGKGPIELTVWFMALDKEKDVRKLLSLEATFAYCNEIRELPWSVIEHIRSRVGQYPPKILCEEPYWYGVFGDTNPPSTDHWVYDKLDTNPPEDFVLFRQPPALIKDDKGNYLENIDAENLEWLPKNYYKDLAVAASPEFISVYLCCNYGTVVEGKPVYPFYNDLLHSSENIEIEKDLDIWLGWDFGLTPACLVCQCTNGQIRCIREFTTDRMYLEGLAEEVKIWININCKGYKIRSVCDPSGLVARDTDGRNSLDILDKIGIPTSGASSNKISTRLGAVTKFLTTLYGSSAGILISKGGCKVLREGFLGKYCFKRKHFINEDIYEEEPKKTHPHSDIQDCLQYVALEISGYSDVKEEEKLKTWQQVQKMF